MEKIKIGFTGTQVGMNNQQKKYLALFFDRLIKEYEVESAHHGDCIGADSQFHNFAIYYKIKTVIHPPKNETKRAFCDGDEILSAEEYLDRNRNIVGMSDIMIATPKEDEEVLRSGTWATIRYSKNQNKRLLIIYPNKGIEIYGHI
jgi:hypothetical protein